MSMHAARGIRMICRGPLDPEDRQRVTDLLSRAASGADGSDESLTSARRVNRTARKRCGFDLTALIDGAGSPGAEGEIECPKCHQVIRYRAAGSRD